MLVRDVSEFWDMNVIILSLDSGNDALSFDRMVNTQGHGLNNLRCICFECNRRSKDLDEHYRA